MITNVADALAPFFSGDKQWDEAIADACRLFLKTFKDETFMCKGCGEIIFPKVTVNEHGIFIESSRAEIRGGKGNCRIERDICDECAKKACEMRNSSSLREDICGKI